MFNIFKILCLGVIFLTASIYSHSNAEAKILSGGQSIMADKFKDVLEEDQYNVLFCEATEKPFSSELLHEKRKGIFTCAACGNHIFRSDTKYDSHTGWPSFYDAIPGSVGTKVDYKIGYARTEFHCSQCGGHFGHIFDDGPKEETGKRYCTNGTALKFIADEDIHDH